MPSVLYLHGFASGPTSAKGRFFQQRFAKAGIPVHIPDLAGGDFPRLTVTRQLDAARRVAAATKPSLLMGSSLGGYLAALLAAQQVKAVPAVALFAPAFNFAVRWAERLGETQMRAWKESNVRQVYHYGEKREMPLRYEFYEDALKHQQFPAFSQPCFIIHGRRDDVVDAAQSIDYAHGKSNIRLEIADSDHALTDVLDEIWPRIWDFYQTHEPVPRGDA